MTALGQLFEIIERETGVTQAQIKSKSRKEELAYLRAIIACYLNKEGCITGIIANIVSRDRATINHYLKVKEDYYKYNRK